MKLLFLFLWSAACYGLGRLHTWLRYNDVHIERSGDEHKRDTVPNL